MTTAQVTSYLRPPSLGEAWQIVAEGGATVRPVSGGTDLAIACPPEVLTLVDLSHAVPHRIMAVGGEITIGAMATLTAITEHPELAGYATGVLPEMLAHVGSPLLRNACTIGGHLARGKLSDVIPVLLALDAEVTIHTGSDERMPLADYYDTGRHRLPHVLTTVHLPESGARSAAAFVRFARTAYDFPLANCCAAFRPDDEVRIVVGGTPHRGQRAFAAEKIVATGGADAAVLAEAGDAAAEEITTTGSWIATAEFRTHLVGVLVRRAVGAAAARRGTA